MYIVIATPRTGPQYRLLDDHTSLGAAIQAANAEVARNTARVESWRNAALVGVEVWEMMATGGWMIPWHRNLWEERKSHDRS